MTSAGRQLIATVAITLGAGALIAGVAAPPERCPDITADDTRAAAAAAVGWIVDNQRPDGTWLYEYDRATDTVIDDYNEVRHAGLISALYQAGARGFDGAQQSADDGLEWAIDHLVERHGWIGMTDSNSVQTGSNALLLAALAERRTATGDDSYDELMAGLARFITEQTEPSGALLAYYDLGPDQPRAKTYSIYYTGEAQWALARMHLLFPDAGWGEPADRMLHYMATARDDAEDLWPPLADHWAGYGVATTAAYPERPALEPLTDAELDFVRRQGGLMGQRVRSIAQRFGPWGVFVRGTFTPRGGGYGVFGEGLTGLWRASLLDERLSPERDTLGERATCITGLAVEAQASTDEAADYPDPTKVAGAWFIDDVTRMDDQQHALSALLMTIPILESTPAPTGAVHPAPIWLLWLLVVIATLNPLRVALGTPGRADLRWRTTALGAIVAAVPLLAIGALSGWMIDLLDTSRPALRLGAASLCLLSAGIDVVRPDPDETVSLPGWRSAFVPVAIPLAFRPAIVIAGLSVVTDHSVPFYGLALAVFVAGATASAIVLPADAFGRRIMVAATRMVAAVAFVASVLLIVDAVFDL